MPQPARQTGNRVLSVSAVTAMIRDQLESLGDFWIEGELSGVKLHSSGHCYFSLKDSGAQLSCTLWRSQLQRVRFRLEDGQKVLVRGTLSVYEPRGTYSLNVLQVEPRGVGDLQLAFEQLKRKLEAEGLFDASRKRPLPFYVNRVGIVTSPTGAALQDMLKIIFRRNPGVTVVVCPARVQGVGAAQEIARGIDRLNRLGGIQVIIAGRGGGSIEDLWCFNEEVVARAIAASALPVVSAVGHEVDYTIADFVADLRAPTPSAAAELVIRDRLELEATLRQLSGRLQRAMQTRIQRQKITLLGLNGRLRDPRRVLADHRKRLESLDERLQRTVSRGVLLRRQRLSSLQSRLQLLSPREQVRRARTDVARLRERLERLIARRLAERRARFEKVIGKLDVLSPLASLARGYAIVQEGGTGAVVQQVAQARVGQRLNVRISDGILHCQVDEVESIEPHSEEL